MNNRIGLYIIAKKELILILIFMFLIAATSFIFGIKVGKEHVYRENRIAPPDQQRVQMLVDENDRENPEEVKPSPETMADEETQSIHSRLEEEIQKQMTQIDDMSPPSTEPEKEAPSSPTDPPPPSPAVKKYTIQLGSYRSQKDAETFAQGFTVRGYQTMIREVSIPSKGTWFRVSLGVFDTTEEARNYIKQEESLFQGEDYIISILL